VAHVAVTAKDLDGTRLVLFLEGAVRPRFSVAATLAGTLRREGDRFRLERDDGSAHLTIRQEWVPGIVQSGDPGAEGFAEAVAESFGEDPSERIAFLHLTTGPVPEDVDLVELLATATWLCNRRHGA